MAIDTRNKRASLFGFGDVECAGLVLPTPDAEFDRADRAHLRGGYAGILPALNLYNREQRFAALGVGEDWNRVLPWPDSSFANLGDRRQLLGLLRGTSSAIGEMSAAALTIVTGSGVFTTEIPLAGAAVSQDSATGLIELGIAGDALARAAAAASLSTGIRFGAGAQVRDTATGIFPVALSVGNVPTIEFTQGQASSVPLGAYAQNYIAMLFTPGAKGIFPGITFNPVTKALDYDGRDLGAATGAPVWRDGNQITVSDGANLDGAALGRPDAAGTLTFDTGLAAAAVARDTATATITTQIRLTGAAMTALQAGGTLTGGADLEGAARSQASATGDLTTAIPLAGQAFIASVATGRTGLPQELAGSATSVVAANGVLTTTTMFSAAALERVLAAGDFTVEIQLAGAAVSRDTATGNFGAVVSGNVKPFRAKGRTFYAQR